MRTITRASMLVLLLGVTACSVQETEIPALTGPSSFALNLKVQAVPDSILHDGASQATISIEARGSDGAPVRGLSLRIETIYQGVVQDFGTLSAKTVVTGENGVASTVYTAPPRPLEPVDQTTIVTFRVTPIGGSPGTPYADYRGAVSRTADLRLVTPGEIRPPNAAPVAQFTASSTSPTVGQTVTFDASGSTDGGVPCGVACTYSWDFGDGHSGTGMFTTHVYDRVGSYQVRLTVTDAGGASHTIALTINVGAGQGPTAAFTFSPTSPAVSQDIFFNASASTAAPGRTIVSYEWDFGSGRTGSGITVTKRYDTPGTYRVTLTVTDNMGAKATAQQTVTVSTTFQARLTATPTTGTAGVTSFVFDARGSTPGPDTFITSYRFEFGDGTPAQDSAAPTASHVYMAPGRYTVSVTVRDSKSPPNTSTAIVVITVTP